MDCKNAELFVDGHSVLTIAIHASQMKGEVLTSLKFTMQLRADCWFIKTEVCMCNWRCIGILIFLMVESGGTYSINQLFELLGGEMVHIPKRPGKLGYTFADTGKIKKSLRRLSTGERRHSERLTR